MVAVDEDLLMKISGEVDMYEPSFRGQRKTTKTRTEPEIEDTKVLMIRLRAGRRKHRFSNGSPHEWRRDENSAYPRTPTKATDGTYRGFHKAPEAEKDPTYKNIDAKVDPDDLGTNAILREFGFNYKERDDMFLFYDKSVVKPASRIAAAYAAKNGLHAIKTEVAHLLEAVHWLGPESVADLVLNENVKPSDILTRDFVKQTVESKPVQNFYIRKPLEVLASNMHLVTGAQLVVGVPYTTPYKKPDRRH